MCCIKCTFFLKKVHLFKVCGHQSGRGLWPVDVEWNASYILSQHVTTKAAIFWLDNLLHHTQPLFFFLTCLQWSVSAVTAVLITTDWTGVIDLITGSFSGNDLTAPHKNPPFPLVWSPKGPVLGVSVPPDLICHCSRGWVSWTHRHSPSSKEQP